MRFVVMRCAVPVSFWVDPLRDLIFFCGVYEVRVFVFSVVLYFGFLFFY